MKFLNALLAQLSIGLVYRLGVPTMCAMIVEHFVTHPHIDDSFGRYPHLATFVIAGLFSSVCAALAASTSSTDKDTMLAVIARTCAATSVWWFIRLALEQDQVFDAMVFYAIAACMLVATAVSLITMPTRSRIGGYVLYGTAAAVVVLFGLYVSGRWVLVLERQEGAVAATLDTYRWLGFRHVSERSASRVTDVVTPFHSKRFTEADSAFVIQGDQEELLLPFGYDSQRTIDRFLNSSESSLIVVEPTSSPWRMSVMWLIASSVLAAGLFLDPLVSQPESKLAKQTSRIIAANFWVAICVFVAASVGTMWHWSSLRNNAKRQIEMLGCTVEDADLEVRGKPLLGSAWKVKVTDRSFDDARLRGLLPHLQHAPGLSLDLSNTRVTDAGLQHLNDLDLLAMLDLRGTAVTGAALAAFKHVHVWYLDVRDTQIRAADLRGARLRNLQYLLFTDPEFSRKSVNQLLQINGLKYVYIDTAGLTPEDLKFWKTEIDFEIEIPDRRAEKAPEDFDF